MHRVVLLAVLLAACIDPGDHEQPPPRPQPPPGALTVEAHPFPGPAGPSTFLDCDGDGRLELYRSKTSSLARLDDAGHWTETPLPYFRADGYRAVAATDLDGDGHLDLVLGGAGLFVAHGTGSCTFAPPRQLVTIDSGGVVALTLVDLDRDGLLDLGVALAWGTDGPFEILHNLGDGAWDRIRIPALPCACDSAYTPGMQWLPFAIHFIDVDGDGALDLFAMSDSGQSWFAWGDPADPFSFTRDDALTERLGPLNPMASALLDHDADGAFDVFVSGDWENSALLVPGSRTPADRAAELHLRTPDLCWSAYPLDADLDGRVDLLVGRSGPMPALYWNLGGDFLDVGEALTTAELSSVNLSCGDVRGDGRIGCYAWRHDMPSDESFLWNDVAPKGGWIGLDLRGRLSGTNAPGARVKVTAGGHVQWLAHDAAHPTRIAHAPGLVAATLDATTADVEVHWPSGLVTTHAGLTPGRRHLLEEPDVLELSGYRLPADGASTLDLMLQLPAGATAASLASEGIGTLDEVGTTEPGTRRFVVRAPPEPGEMRLRLTVDGQPLAVRPRIRFTAH